MTADRVRPAGEIGRLASAALMTEAALFPKPGLVTPVSQGAHGDMSFPLFLASARALEPCFSACARAGAEASTLAGLLDVLRPIGREGETAMFRATGGINTHRGAVFCLGLLVAAALFVGPAGDDTPWGDRACRAVSGICTGLVDRELAEEGPQRSAGGRLYKELGVRGARGQAEDGYPSLRRALLPVLRSARAKGPEGFRLGCLDALLLSMSELEDSCLLARGGMEGLDLVRREAARVLALGGAGHRRGMRALEEMERLLIQRNLSPGGSADLLAAAIFLTSAEAAAAREARSEGARLIA